MQLKKQRTNMKKTFLIYSAIIEALTGIGLIFAPSLVASILLKTVLSSSLEKLLALVAGAAISSVALGAWISRNTVDSSVIIKSLFLYNSVITIILLYSIFSLGFGGFILWAVILFHFIQSILSMVILNKKTPS
jgi:hypothetical protein